MPRSAIRKKTNKKYKRTKDLQESTKYVKSVVTGIEWSVLEKSILMNVKKKRTSIIKAHEKKLKNFFLLPFTSDKVIANLSNYQLSDTERDLLKYGLSYMIPPRSINKTDICTTFEKLNRYLCTELKNTEDTETLRAQLSQLANSYYSKYKPSTQTLKKHGILKKLRENKDIVITYPDKGNGVVIMNRKDYDKAMCDILENNSKFRKQKKIQPY